MRDPSDETMAIIGIDLGTTNSLAAVFRPAGPELVPNALGEFLTPSAVSVDDNGEILVGRAARDRAVTHPERTAVAFKRRMGNREPIALGDQQLTPEELSSLVIAQLRRDAEAFLGDTVDEAVVSVPAYFNDTQRRATRVAAELAGLKVERLINEPTAAAIAYGLHAAGDERRMLVVDLGGGTFDVSVMELYDDVMEVHASAGDNFFGGEDFDELLETAFLRDADIDGTELSRRDRARLRAAVVASRHALTGTTSTGFELMLDGRTHRFSLDRARFESLTAGLLKRLAAPIERALRDSRVVPADLNEVILVGGSTRMPAVRSLVGRMLRCIPRSTISPDHVVALGAAVQAGLKRRDRALRDVVLTDVSPYTLGVEVAVSREGQVHEAGHFLPIIERNTTVPVSRTERLSTVSDNQRKILCSVFQGESRLVKNNVPIGSLEVEVPTALAGDEQVDVRFTYDVNGILEVQVTVVSTGASHRAVIRNAANELSDAEIEASLAKLAGLKIHPRDQSANRAVLARAERMYEQSLGDERQYLGQLMAQFESVLDQQDPDVADRARASFERVLDEIADRDFHL